MRSICALAVWLLLGSICLEGSDTLRAQGLASPPPQTGPAAQPVFFGGPPTAGVAPSNQPMLSAPLSQLPVRQPSAPTSFLLGPEAQPAEWQAPVATQDLSALPPVAPEWEALEARLKQAEADLAAVRAQLALRTGSAGGPPSGGPDPVTGLAPASEGASAGPGLLDRMKKLEDLFKADKGKLPNVRLSGFFHFDTGLFSQDAESMATLGDIQNGSGFRRARLQGIGNVAEFTKVSIEMDFGFAAAGRPSFMDVWGEQSNLPYFGAVRIGQYRQPVTMDSWTNIKHLEFIERSAPFQAFDPFRRVGAMSWINSEDERSLLAYSLFGTGVTFFNNGSTVYITEGPDNRFATQIGDNGGVAFAARGTHLLWYDEPAEGRYLGHLGAGYVFADIGGDGSNASPFASTYQARSVPEFFVGDPAGGGLTAGGTPFVVDTGRFLANNYHMFHVEYAMNHGSAHLQAEYIATAVNQMNGPNVFYDGAYVQGGYFLTGEAAGYNKQMGALDYNVEPFQPFFAVDRGMCGWGAWEIAARWSWLDLSARNIDPANQVGLNPSGTVPPVINPGVLNESTVGLNWYWNQYARMQFNWIHTMLDNNARGFSSMDIFALRFGVEF